MQNYFHKATVQVRYFFKSVDFSDLSSNCTLHCVRGTLQDPCRLCAFPPPNWRSGRGQNSHPRWPLRPRQPRSQSGWAAVHLRWPLSARWPRCLDLKRLDWCPSSLAAQCSTASISKRLDRSPSSVAAQCSMASISKRSDRSPSSVVAQDAMASISLWGGISLSSTLEIQALNWAKMASILPCSVSVVWLPSMLVGAIPHWTNRHPSCPCPSPSSSLVQEPVVWPDTLPGNYAEWRLLPHISASQLPSCLLLVSVSLNFEPKLSPTYSLSLSTGLWVSLSLNCMEKYKHVTAANHAELLSFYPGWALWLINVWSQKPTSITKEERHAALRLAHAQKINTHLPWLRLQWAVVHPPWPKE